MENADFPGEGGPEHELQEYEGNYVNAGYGMLQIKNNEGGLEMKYHDMEIPAAHVQGEVFRIDGIKSDILTMSAPLTFFNGKDGKVGGLKIPLEPLVEDIVFSREVLART